MRCWNCNKKLPKGAKACQFCEAPVQAKPTKGEVELVREVMEGLDEEAHEAFLEAFRNSNTAEEFVNAIMVGPCPRCGSSDVDHCDNDPEINDITVGRCFQCGQLWCTECEQVFKKDQVKCDRCTDE
jgi:hypothetical protein